MECIVCVTAVCAKLFGQRIAFMLERDKEGEGLSCGGGVWGGICAELVTEDTVCLYK